MKITKKALVGAVTEKIRKPISTMQVDPWGYKQSVSLTSSDLAELKDKKIGDKVCFYGEGILKSINEGDRFNVEINKIG